jgi:hypothetical protein
MLLTVLGKTLSVQVTIITSDQARIVENTELEVNILNLGVKGSDVYSL